MNKKALKLLYRSFDARLSQRNQRKLAEALDRSPELRNEKVQLQAQRSMLAKSQAHAFSPQFADRVIQRLKTETGSNGWEQFYETLLTLFRRFAVIGAVILFLLLSYNLKLGDKLSLEEVFFASDAAYEELQRLSLF